MVDKVCQDLVPTSLDFKCSKSRSADITGCKSLEKVYWYKFCLFKYSHFDFLKDVRKLYWKTGVDNKPTVFLFTDTQVVEESFLEDINNILSSGEVPNLYNPEEFEEVRNVIFILCVRMSVCLSVYLILCVYACMHACVCVCVHSIISCV